MTAVQDVLQHELEQYPHSDEDDYYSPKDRIPTLCARARLVSSIAVVLLWLPLWCSGSMHRGTALVTEGRLFRILVTTLMTIYHPTNPSLNNSGHIYFCPKGPLLDRKRGSTCRLMSDHKCSAKKNIGLQSRYTQKNLSRFLRSSGPLGQSTHSSTNTSSVFDSYSIPGSTPVWIRPA